MWNLLIPGHRRSEGTRRYGWGGQREERAEGNGTRGRIRGGVSNHASVGIGALNTAPL